MNRTELLELFYPFKHLIDIVINFGTVHQVSETAKRIEGTAVLKVVACNKNKNQMLVYYRAPCNRNGVKIEQDKGIIRD